MPSDRWVSEYVRRLKGRQDNIVQTLREDSGPQKVVDQRSGIDGVAISDSVSSTLTTV